MRTLVLIGLLCFAGHSAAEDDVPVAGRKLVEYGWDVPNSDFVAGHIGEMEQRPFDGVLFRLQGGQNVLEPVAWPGMWAATSFAKVVLPTCRAPMMPTAGKSSHRAANSVCSTRLIILAIITLDVRIARINHMRKPFLSAT